MKSVLLHVDEDTALESRLQVALDLCRNQDAHLTCLQATPYSAYVAFDPLGAAFTQQDLVADVRAREAALREKIEARLAQEDVRWDWAAADGDVVRLLAAWSAVSDVVVVSQAAPSKDLMRPQAVASDLVFEAQCPVLVVPDAMEALDLKGPVVVGWNASPEAARAIRLSIPLLKDASAVHIVTIGEDDADMPQMAASTYLSRHGVSSDLHSVPSGNGKPQEVLLKFAHEVGARMVVMGAFGRSRLRETLLGGVTKALLGHSDVALLMAH